MVFKTILILAAFAQLLAAGLALRINLRYRIYSAWFLLSAAASVGAILRLTTLSEVWTQTPTLYEDRNLWLSTVAALLASILLLGGMALIEPFFVRISEAEKTLRQEHRQLTTIVRATEEELKLAQRIQRRLLPASAVKLPGLDIAGVSHAAEWTSGDYFDYLSLRSGRTAVVIADVCGHGIGPALLMSSTRASLRGLAPTLDDVGELRAELPHIVGERLQTLPERGVHPQATLRRSFELAGKRLGGDVIKVEPLEGDNTRRLVGAGADERGVGGHAVRREPGEVVDRLDQVGLALAVAPDERGRARPELDIDVGVGAEVVQQQM